MNMTQDWNPTEKPHASGRARLFRVSRVALYWAIASFVGTFALAADSPELPLIEVQARFIHATQAQARKAFGNWLGADSLKPDLTPEQARRALKSLLQQKADVFSNPRLVAQSGSPATAEEVRELRYPTQFDPSKEEPGKFIPVAFETRNVGVMLKVEAGVVDGGLRLAVEPRVVRFLGFIAVDQKLDGKVKEPTMADFLKRGFKEGEQYGPVFDMRSAAMQLPVESGEALAVSELPIGETAKEIGTDVRTFVFITARALSAKPASGAANSPKK